MSNLMSDLVSAKLMHSQIQGLHSTKSSFHDRGNCLKKEIELDLSRGGDVSKKQKQLEDVESKINSINNYISDAASEQKKLIDKISKETDETGKTDKDKKTDEDKKTGKDGKSAGSDKSDTGNTPAAVVEISTQAAVTSETIVKDIPVTDTRAASSQQSSKTVDITI